MARLPDPGSDDGVWGNVLNTYLSVEHNADGTLKSGGSLSAKADDTNVVHNVGSETIAGVKTFSSAPIVPSPSSATDVANKAYVDNAPGSIYPLAAYGLIAATDNPMSYGSSSAITNGDSFFARLYVPAGATISAIKIAVQTTGSYVSNGRPNQLALYDDNGTQIGLTPDDSTLWSAVGWRMGTLPSPIAAQNTGRFVYAGFILSGYSNVSPALPLGVNIAAGILNGSTNGKKRGMYMNGLLTLPVSFNPATYGNTTSYIPLFGLVA